MEDEQRKDHVLPVPGEVQFPETSPWTTYLIPEEPGPPPTRITSLLRRQWPVILAATAVVFIATALFTASRPSVYQSSSSFLLQAGGPLDVLQDAPGGAGIETEASLFRSQRVVEPAVESMALHARVQTPDGSRPISEVFPSFRISRDTEPGVYRVVQTATGVYELRAASDRVLASAAPGASLEYKGIVLSTPAERDEYSIVVSSFDATVAAAVSRLEALPAGRDSDIIRLTCRGPSGESAYTLCQAISDSYLRLRTELQRAEATATAEFLREQVANVEERLKAAEDSLGDYQERTLAIALDARASAEIQNQAGFQSQRDRLEAERIALSGLIGRIESGGGQYRDLASFPTFLQSGNPVIGALLGTLVDLENRRADLLRTRTDRNPDVVAIDTRIGQIENELKAIATNYDHSLRAQIESFGVMAGRAGGRASAIPEKQVIAGRLERQVTLLDDLYRLLQTRLREAEIAQSVTQPGVEIVDRPALPLAPSSPNVPLNLALGLVLGLGFGVLIALYRERSDTRVRERGVVEKTTGVPVLAMIPPVDRPGPILPVSGPSGNGMRAVVPARQSIDYELAREAFRGLVADLQIAAHHLQNGGIRSVAITSSMRGEGKTFSACNLALAHTNATTRTLLIDTDVRGRGVTRFFGLPKSGPGLFDVLAGSVRLDQASRPLTVDGRGELFVLTCGEGTRDSNLLDLERLGHLMREAESQFDMVILDTPPLNVLADAATVAATVDTVMVVVRGGVTDRQALGLTIDRLRRSRGQIIGILLNDVELPEYYTSYSLESED